jgi:hypothetical protein
MTLAQRWKTCQATLLLNAPSEVMKLAKMFFYTGAMAHAHTQLQIVNDTESTDEEKIKFLEAMDEELADFVRTFFMQTFK